MDASVYIEKLKNELKETQQKKDFNNSEIQYHGKTKNYKKQQPEND